jgi:hypothetical protein
MPKVKWKDLPPQLRQHLFDRAKERKISMEDLFALEEWRLHSPDVPEGTVVQGFRIFQAVWRRSIPENFPFARPARAW